MFKIKGFGWKRDYNDIRDYTPNSEPIKQVLETAKNESPITQRVLKKEELKPFVDNRKWTTPVADQGNLGSCTAQAGVTLYEYMSRKAYGAKGQYIDGSRLFLYKRTRFLMGPEGIGDSGAYIRTTLGAIRAFGVPPEEYYPYTDRTPDFDREPPAAVGDLAKEWQSAKQFRLDYSPDPEQNIARIKEYLAKGYAAMMGFMVFTSYSQANTNGGAFPYPASNERIEGGHAVLIVGYDDNKVITNTTNGSNTTGAFLIQNSWGTDWGDKGFGWIPYQYFRLGANGDVLADDIWTITKVEWLSTGEFFW